MKRLLSKIHQNVDVEREVQTPTLTYAATGGTDTPHSAAGMISVHNAAVLTDQMIAGQRACRLVVDVGKLVHETIQSENRLIAPNQILALPADSAVSQ